jgi:alkaline phosphatase D
VLHLGDYLYEHANGVYGDGAPLGRIPAPDRELVSLADYRERHAQYKADPDSQAMHRQHAFIAVWDDHEFANDAWREGAQNHQPGEGDWWQRRESAARAYFEWMPIRESSSAREARIWRSFRFGDLAELAMLDTRLVGRDDPAGARDAPERSLLGAEQERWLFETLAASQREQVAWRVLGQQVLLAPVRRRDRAIVSADKWDGFPAARARFLDLLERESIDDTIVLTGDFHSSWALDVAREPFSRAGYDAESGRGSLAVEFVAPGISAPGFPDPREAAARAAELRAVNPHVHWIDFHHQGYGLLDLDRERAQGEWWFVDAVRERRRGEHFARAFRTLRGANHLEAVAAASEPPASPARLA